MENETKNAPLTASELALYLGCEVETRHISPFSGNYIKQNHKLDGRLLFDLSAYEYAIPHLRHLSDMTEEEAVELCKIAGYKIKNQTVGMGRTFIDRDRFTPAVFQYLLSRHFDLFGYIESGRAIRKS